ncbi:hypothetical protein A8950_2706 [Dongia mobilis]|uniref:Uncharacterized protein n=1 Tax=Dongia mobilis TaxID=578943 RepID=A0A4R6WQC6_9PROT|nr:hypothetical protein [Dongia mobilis]TDQ80838.1 hypothetical protein A8950_2706 [Dongia mobilis]
MFRLMSIATLVMILVCFFVGASIALADPVKTPANDNAGNAPAAVDVYDFSDYFREYMQQPGTRPANPVDAQEVEEPQQSFFDTLAC